MSNCDCQKTDCNCGSSSGFVFGLILGAVIGAVIAVLIYKNDKGEVFEKLEQKIKGFFENLIPKPETKTSTKTKSNNPQKTIAKKTTKALPKKEITPVFVKPKKPTPKTFIKAKK